MNRRERTVVTGVHGLEHVEGFFAADLTNDDAVRTHTQAVDQELALINGALAFDIGWTSFETHHVFLVELQFGGVFDGNDALAVGQIGREHVEKRGLSSAGTAGNQNVEARFNAALKELEHGRGESMVGDEIVGRERVAAETPDGEAGAIDGERRNNGVNAGTVGEARVHHRRRFIDAAPNRGDDAVDDAHQVSVIAELNVCGFEKTLALDVNFAESVDQNIGNRGIGEKRFERSQAENFIENFLGKTLALLQIHRCRFADDELLENERNFAANVVAANVVDAIQVEFLDEPAMNRGLNRG